MVAGILVFLLPPISVETLIMNMDDLEQYKQSAFGRYIRTYMTTPVVMVRMLGTVITHLGAWYRLPALIPLGLATVLFGWLRGVLLPKRS